LLPGPRREQRREGGPESRIVAAGGNSIATALFVQTGPRLLRYWHTAAQVPDVSARFAAEHGELVERVLAGDATGFAASLDHHLAGARR